MSKNGKPKAKAKKLKIDARRVRSLDTDELGAVQGGMPPLTGLICKCCSGIRCCVSEPV